MFKIKPTGSDWTSFEFSTWSLAAAVEKISVKPVKHQGGGG